MKLTSDNLDQLAWEKMDGLIPCVMQNAVSGKMLTLGYTNREAIEKTLEIQKVTFFSRSKNRLWTKGETSGNTLDLVHLSADCDYDASLALARPNGPTCHTGTESCWFNAPAADLTFLADLETKLAGRKDADPESSYTARLYAKGVKRIAQKVGEEGVETALAAATNNIEELNNEAADLL